MTGKLDITPTGEHSYDLHLDGVKLPHVTGFDIHREVGESPQVTVTFIADVNFSDRARVTITPGDDARDPLELAKEITEAISRRTHTYRSIPV